ncbi:hypothetical protein AB0J81_41245, partial [Streptomyces bobili]
SEYLLGGATSSSFPCSGQPYWVPVRKLRGPSRALRSCASAPAITASGKVLFIDSWPPARSSEGDICRHGSGRPGTPGTAASVTSVSSKLCDRGLRNRASAA